MTPRLKTRMFSAHAKFLIFSYRQILFSSLYFGVLVMQRGITIKRFIRENRILKKQNIGILLLMPINFEVKIFMRRAIRS